MFCIYSKRDLNRKSMNLEIISNSLLGKHKEEEEKNGLNDLIQATHDESFKGTSSPKVLDDIKMSTQEYDLVRLNESHKQNQTLHNNILGFTNNIINHFQGDSAFISQLPQITQSLGRDSVIED